MFDLICHTWNCTFCNVTFAHAQQLWPHAFLLSPTYFEMISCVSLLFSFQAHNPSKRLNYIIICPSSVLLRYVAHCSQIISPVPLDHWKTLYCICKTCSLEVKILQRFLHRGLGPVSPEFFVFILYESPMSLTSSEESEKANVRICSVEVCMHTYSISVQSVPVSNSASVSLEYICVCTISPVLKAIM